MNALECFLGRRAQIYAIQWNFIPYVAPADFDPDAQEINIYNEFIYNTNPNKHSVFSISSSVTSSVISAGNTYYYGEYVSGTMNYYTVSASTLITWTAGSTKRHVFIISSDAGVTIRVPQYAIWGYFGRVFGTLDAAYLNLKYVHSHYEFPNLYYFGTALTGIINFPKSVTSIISGAFTNCTGLVGELYIPENITSISGFGGCTGLTKVILHSGITNYGGGVFQNCTNLTGTIIFGSGVTTIGSYCFSGTKMSMVNLTIPPLVTSIPTGAFYACWYISGILTIHSGVTAIGDNAFFNMTSITRINNYATTPQPITYDIMKNVTKPTLHVPVGCKAAYQANSYWNLFPIIEDL